MSSNAGSQHEPSFWSRLKSGALWFVGGLGAIAGGIALFRWLKPQELPPAPPPSPETTKRAKNAVFPVMARYKDPVHPDRIYVEHGSCVCIGTDSGPVFLTNAHVAPERQKSGDKLIDVTLLIGGYDCPVTVDKRSFIKNGVIGQPKEDDDANGIEMDCAVLRLTDGYTKTSEGIKVNGVDTLEIKPLSLRPTPPSIGEPVYVAGYPEDAAGTALPKLIITRGRMHSADEKKLTATCATGHGASGGAMMDKDGNVIGLVNSGRIPNQSTRIMDRTNAIPAAKINDFITSPVPSLPPKEKEIQKAIFRGDDSTTMELGRDALPFRECDTANYSPNLPAHLFAYNASSEKKTR